MPTQTIKDSPISIVVKAVILFCAVSIVVIGILGQL